MSNEPTNDAEPAPMADAVDPGEIPVEVETGEDMTRPLDASAMSGTTSSVSAPMADSKDTSSAEDDDELDTYVGRTSLTAEDWAELVAELEVERTELKTQLAEASTRAEAAEVDKQDNYDRLLRSTADMENLRRRTKKDVEDARADARTKVLKEMLPIVDNLQRAVEHSTQSGGDTANVLDGVQLVLRQFSQAFERCNVVSVEAAGKPFDPNVHEAVSQDVREDVPAGTIVQVLQNGYKLGERLLRPAMVVVATGGPHVQSASGDDELSDAAVVDDAAVSAARDTEQ